MNNSSLGALGVLLLLGACGPNGCNNNAGPPSDLQKIKIYGSMTECQGDVDENGIALHSAEDCTKAFNGAQEEHAKSAPRFSTASTCEEKYGPGNCVPRHEESGDVFMPLMAGFLLGHALGGGPSIVSQPIYIDRGGSAYAGPRQIGSYRSCSNDPSSCSGGRGGSFGYVYGGAGARSDSVWSSGGYATQRVAPSTVSRGGFGGSASSVTMPSSGASSFATAPSSGSVSTGVARGGFGGTAATSSASSGGE